ncbi:MAG: hypothetical protein ISS25_04220 [Nanoarchaeota archaeon]|nr:hypothetical protein [DPANN group archaeon]MBL7117007.1 hypothetical protein [Nanoarchaeota archaeon]
MDWTQIALIGLGLFVILAIFFKRYLTALIYDYVVDCGLSFADNLLLGAGLIGLDIGDWIAAVLIFIKERKITNGFLAGLVAWEATNFIPFSLIPIVGEGLEIFFNFFPAVFIGRLLFNKFGKAEKQEKKLEKDMGVAERAGIDVSKEKDVLADVKKLINSEDPVDALKEAKKYDKEITQKLINYVNRLMSDTQGVIQNIIRQKPEGSDEVVDTLQEAIIESEQLLSMAKKSLVGEDFETAVGAAINAKKILVASFKQCDEIMRQQGT